MAVVLSVVCDLCRSEYRPLRADWARADGPARARAAVHGWATADVRGITQDVCPACLQQAVPVQQRAAQRVLVGAGSAASAQVAPPAPVERWTAPEADVAVCRWCADGEHQWCSGCECSAH